MRRRHVHVTASSAASPEVIFGLLADGRSWPDWSPIESFELERPGATAGGDSAAEGAGAIRVFRRGRTTGRDRIRELVPNRRLVYESLSGLPVRDYIGEVALERTVGGGTTITWRASFFPTRPGTGWLLERGIRRFLQQCADGLAEYAATTTGSPAATAEESA